MAIFNVIADAVCELGRAKVDDLVPLFPDMTRKQIEKALSNAKWHGLIHCIEPAKQEPGYRGTLPGVYGPPPDRADPDGWPRGTAFDANPSWVRPSSSVWEYAQRAANDSQRRSA